MAGYFSEDMASMAGKAPGVAGKIGAFASYTWEKVANWINPPAP
jgi:hypothetical protein